MTGLLIAGAEVGRRAPVDVRVAGERIAEVGTGLRPRRGEAVLEAGGGALLPGLHDHHVHLMAMAAAASSVRCGPPEVVDRVTLAAVLRRAAAAGGPATWVRGVGYHESVAGDLDRAALDAMVAGRPVRVQHRSGAMWAVNGAGARLLGLDDAHDGRLFGADRWLRERLGPDAPPDLAPVGRLLAGFGVTGVTDATATNDAGALAALRHAVAAGALPQRLVVMGDLSLAAPGHPRVRVGPVKVAPADHALPALGDLTNLVRAAHVAGRAVAVHCVTREGLVLALAAFEDAGARPGDRIEHASVAPPEAVGWMARLGLTVVTQPNFVAERGDAYLAGVEADDVPWLYRCAGLAAAGVPVGGGTDAPFGGPDPWRAMRAAVERRAPSGAVVAGDERVSPERALRLFTTAPGRPGGRARRVAPGAPADLCLLRAPWADARADLTAGLVAATVIGGAVHEPAPPPRS